MSAQELVLPPGKLGLELESVAAGKGLRVKKWGSPVFQLSKLPAGSVIASIDGRAVADMDWVDAVALLRASQRRLLSFHAAPLSLSPALGASVSASAEVASSGTDAGVNDENCHVNINTNTCSGTKQQQPPLFSPPAMGGISLWSQPPHSPVPQSPGANPISATNQERQCLTPLVDRGVGNEADALFRQPTASASASACASTAVVEGETAAPRTPSVTFTEPPASAARPMQVPPPVSPSLPPAEAVLGQQQQEGPGGGCSLMQSCDSVLSVSPHVSPQHTHPTQPTQLQVPAATATAAVTLVVAAPVPVATATATEGTSTAATTEPESARATQTTEGAGANPVTATPLTPFGTVRVQQQQIRALKADRRGVDAQVLLLRYQRGRGRQALGRPPVPAPVSATVEKAAEEAEEDPAVQEEQQPEEQQEEQEGGFDRESWLLHWHRFQPCVASLPARGAEEQPQSASTAAVTTTTTTAAATVSVAAVGTQSAETQCDPAPAAHTGEARGVLSQRLEVQARFISRLKLQLRANVDAQISMHERLSMEECAVTTTTAPAVQSVQSVQSVQPVQVPSCPPSPYEVACGSSTQGLFRGFSRLAAGEGAAVEKQLEQQERQEEEGQNVDDNASGVSCLSGMSGHSGVSGPMGVSIQDAQAPLEEQEGGGQPMVDCALTSAQLQGLEQEMEQQLEQVIQVHTSVSEHDPEAELLVEEKEEEVDEEWGSGSSLQDLLAGLPSSPEGSHSTALPFQGFQGPAATDAATDSTPAAVTDAAVTPSKCDVPHKEYGELRTPSSEVKKAWRFFAEGASNADVPVGLSPAPLKDHIHKIRGANSLIREDLERFRSMLARMSS